MGRLSSGATDFLRDFRLNEGILQAHTIRCDEVQVSLGARVFGSPMTFDSPERGIYRFGCRMCGWFRWEDRRGTYTD